MKVCIFGAGYVGLVQGAVLAEVGNVVTCVDISEERVAQLSNGIVPIHEPGLSEIITSCVSNQTLSFTTNAYDAINDADVIFIAVGTPPDEDGSADLKYVLGVAKTIGESAKSNKVVVTKSTVPVGTGALVEEKLRETALEGVDFDVVSNPEFLKEGAAINDCKYPDRIIIGTDSQKAINLLTELYTPFMRNHGKIITMDRLSSELTKYAANAFLATKISFMNEMSNIAEQVGADVENVRIGVGSDPRIGSHFIYPGCGYGGSCFPKDVKALIQSSNELGYEPQILQSVESVNDRQKHKLSGYIASHYNVTKTSDSLENKTFALWGLSFKPNTDDMREAPSLHLIDALLKSGAKFRVYDPEAMSETKRILNLAYSNEILERIVFCDSPMECIEGSDALVLNTEWECFRSPDFNKIKNLLSDSVVFDGRNLYDPKKLESLGFSYYGIGRGLSVKK
tara:strand:+ start:11014 stop:12375 length:1362 start_codon:yes stop_codon:yes gene_type:complete